VTVEAVQLKKDYHTAMGSAAALIGQIEQSEVWSWARNGENLGKLKSLHGQVLTLHACLDAALCVCALCCHQLRENT
jgi:hypothetical protein